MIEIGLQSKTAREPAHLQGTDEVLFADGLAQECQRLTKGGATSLVGYFGPNRLGEIFPADPIAPTLGKHRKNLCDPTVLQKDSLTG
jgi:hypothetical protein